MGADESQVGLRGDEAMRSVTTFIDGVYSVIPSRPRSRIPRGELDRTVTGAQRTGTAHDLPAAKLDVAWLSTLRAGIEAGTGPVDFAPPDDASDCDVARTRAAMEAQAREQAAKLASIEQQIARKAAEAGEVAAAITTIRPPVVRC